MLDVAYRYFQQTSIQTNIPLVSVTASSNIDLVLKIILLADTAVICSKTLINRFKLQCVAVTLTNFTSYWSRQNACFLCL